MSNPYPPNNPPESPVRPREGAWAKPTERLSANQVQADINLNVDGKQLAGPLRGFGQMWQKTYRICLPDVQATPKEVVQVWKDHFGNFWSAKNHFYSAGSSIHAGEVAVLNLAGPYGLVTPSGKGLVSTGVLVIYDDDESFCFMTPEGHMFGGMITFSSLYEEDQKVWVQVQALIRANDPLYEIGARLGIIHKMEDDHWHTVLKNLALRFGVQAAVEQTNVLVDPRLIWNQTGNIRHNAAIHTGIYLVFSPFRWLRRVFRPKSNA